jgi:hypothetical protein
MVSNVGGSVPLDQQHLNIRRQHSEIVFCGNAGVHAVKIMVTEKITLHY